MMNNKKVSIIGSGMVGSNIAYSMMLKNLVDEIVLIDINEKLVQGEILDIKHGFSNFGYSNIYSGDYSDIKDSDLIIITAGRSRKPNETRLDMVIDNVKISKLISQEINKYYNGGLIIVVSNPVDIITYKMSEYLNLNKNLIFGTGCILDTSRFIFSISDYIRCKTSDVDGMIIGEHGDSQVAVWSQTKIKNVYINDYCQLNDIKWTDEEKVKLEKDVSKMGAAIIEKKGKTHYGIATSVCYLADIILNNKEEKVCISKCLNGEYGISDVALSLPFILNENGIKKVMNEKLNENEMLRLKSSSEKLKEVLNKI